MVMDVWRPSLLRSARPSTMLHDMERMLDESFETWPFRMMWRRLPDGEMAWAPSLELVDKEDSFQLKAELPGMKKEDIDISVTGDTLTIKGERKAKEEVKEEDYIRSEICYGAFTRSITLPATVDTSKIEATYENGILDVKLPKVKEATPSKVHIKAK